MPTTSAELIQFLVDNWPTISATYLGKTIIEGAEGSVSDKIKKTISDKFFILWSKVRGNIEADVFKEFLLGKKEGITKEEIENLLAAQSDVELTATITLFEDFKQYFEDNKNRLIRIEDKQDKAQESLDRIEEKIDKRSPVFTLPHLISIPPIPDVCIGRDDQIIDLHNLLIQNSSVAVVKGFGGIGKTTMAAYYYKKYHSYYTNGHVAWIDAENGIVETLKKLSFFKDVPYSLGGSYADKIKQYTSSIQAIEEIVIPYLANINKGPNLLILDNLTHPIEYEKTEYGLALLKLKSLQNWKVLITSREEQSGIKTMRLDILKKDDAAILFAFYYLYDCSEETAKELINTSENTDILSNYDLPINYKEKIYQIVENTGRHTLAITFTAKIGKHLNWGLEQIVKRTTENPINFTGIDLDQILGGDNPQQRAIDKKLIEYFIDLYPIRDIDSKEKIILFFMCFLPSTPHSAEFIYRFILGRYHPEFNKDIINRDSDYDDFIVKLNTLVDRGLIERVKNGYYCHALISLSIESQVEKIEKIASVVFDTLNILLVLRKGGHAIDIINEIKIVEYIVEKRVYKGIKYSEADTYSISNLFSTLASFNNTLGYYIKGEEYYNRGKDIIELSGSLSSHIQNTLAEIYMGLGVINKNLGNFSKAEENYFKTIEIITKDKFERDNKELLLATIYMNLGVLYRNKSLPEAAENYYIKCKDIREDAYARNENEYYGLAEVYINLGNLYSSLDVFDKAEEYYLKGEQIWLKLISEDKNHPALGIIYVNLLNMYRQSEKLAEAEAYSLKAKKIIEHNYLKINPSSPELAALYLNMGILYEELEKEELCFLYAAKAIAIVDDYSDNQLYKDEAIGFYTDLIEEKGVAIVKEIIEQLKTKEELNNTEWTIATKYLKENN